MAAPAQPPPPPAAAATVRVGVGVAILSDEHPNRMLAGQRQGSHGAGTWALPGGHLEMGESVRQTAVREIKEETNLDLDPATVRLVGVTQDVFDPASKHYITLITCARLAASSSALRNMEPHKCEGWEWVTLQELAERKEACFLPLQHALATFFDPEQTPDLAALAAKGQVMD